MLSRRHFSKPTFLLLPLVFAAVWPAPADVRIAAGQESASIEISGEPFATLQFGKQTGRPFLHPLRTASGKIITRGPQSGTQGSVPLPAGLWMGHARVNGVDYWEAAPGAHPNHKAGSVVFREITKIEQGVDRGSIWLTADWIDPDGAAVVTEKRTMAFSAGPEDSRIIDIDCRLEPRQRVLIGDSTNGILGLRLAAPFEEINGGRPRTFTGDAGSDGVTGKRSPWLDYMTIMQRERIGVLIMDHPRNHNFPTRWKVRTEASIIATPFAELDYYNAPPLKGPAPKTARDAGVTLEKGETLRFRYRIVIHPSTLDIDQAWRDFCEFNWDRR
ncbi:MAG: PmoA family protein [Bryobacteraceae bacterium]